MVAVVLVFAAVLALGWIVPLVIGIAKVRKSSVGILLIVIGGVWGVFALSVSGVALYSYRQVSRFTEVEDFDPADYQGETGSIVVPHKGKSSLVVRDEKSGRQMKLSTTDGVLTVPVGTYELSSYEAVSEEENGTKWEASASLYGLASNKISVESASDRQLDIGPPFTAKVVVGKKARDTVSFDLELTGRGGCQYTIRKAGQALEAPSFHIADESGKILWQGKFRYG